MRAVPGMLAAVLLAAASLTACGGGGGSKSASSTATSPPPTTSTGRTGTSTKPPTASAPETPSATGESQPGGAGDETPAHFDASLTGRGGRISPRSVAVVPFISVRVILKSDDSSRYTLTVNGKTLAARPGAPAELTLAGLKPGHSYVLRDAAGGPSVKITANAEPGP
jgi:hypothetical protein